MMPVKSSIDLPSVLSVFMQLFGRRSSRQWLKCAEAGRCAQAKPAKGVKSKKAPCPSRKFYQRIFSPRVTLWYLIFQRLNADKTQAAVVADIRRGGADRLSGSAKNPLSKKIRSHKTSSYNGARQRMPLEFLKDALARMIELATVVGGRTFRLIDGSTLPMLANKVIAREYPPARNQSGQSDWCLMRVVVSFCAYTGLVLGAAQAGTGIGEQALAWSLIERATAATVWIGDRNFGVWSVVAKALFHNQDVIVRLTKVQANRLAGKKSWRSAQDTIVSWRRGRKNQVPPGTENLEVQGRLIFVRVRREGRYINLWIFTTLLDSKEFSVERLVALYALRWQAELNFRYLKTVLEMEQLFVASPEMARKELYAGLVAYNLVRMVMAAASSSVPPGPGLSFSQVRRVLVLWLIDWGKDWRSRKGDLQNRFEELVKEATEHLLPKRKSRRSEPRRVRHRRLKFPPLIGSRAAARRKSRKTRPKSW
jgi:hypothetical protein